MSEYSFEIVFLITVVCHAETEYVKENIRQF